MNPSQKREDQHKSVWFFKVSLSKKSQRLIYASLDNIIVDYKLFSYLKMISDQ